MANGDDSGDKIIKYVNDLKAKEAELIKREEELKKLEETSEAVNYERRIKILEENLDKAKKELDEKTEILKNVRTAAGMEDIISLEKKLKAKEAELSNKEHKLALLGARVSGDYSEVRQLEYDVEKVRSGDPILDNLLNGGIPFGTNALVMGPPFIGKETLVNSFILEGLVKGIPALVITTDQTPADLLEEVKYIDLNVEKYCENSLLKFIDAYSKAMGIAEEQKGVIPVEHPTAYKEIMQAFEDISKEFSEKAKYFRMSVRSLSTLITYSDTTSTYRFLQGLTGKSKRMKNVALYLLDKAMHNESDIQTIGHLMDGAIDFKTDGTKTYFQVQGIGDVQSRAWIQYQYAKRGLQVGSFTLDHIKP